MDGHLELMLSNELPSKDFENPPYSGVKLQAKWNSVSDSEIKDQMPKYGYFETKLKVRALRTKWPDDRAPIDSPMMDIAHKAVTLAQTAVPWALIKVPTDRRGRACRIRLVPDGNEWNLNPNNVEGDLTAKKAARITLMDNSKWGEEKSFKNLEFWLG